MTYAILLYVSDFFLFFFSRKMYIMSLAPHSISRHTPISPFKAPPQLFLKREIFRTVYPLAQKMIVWFL